MESKSYIYCENIEEDKEDTILVFIPYFYYKNSTEKYLLL
jgi:hypothetical protein